MGNKFDSAMKEKIEALKKEEIMKRMHQRYLKYYINWRDYDMLTTILAMIGLLLAISEVSFLAFITIIARVIKVPIQ